MNSIQKKIDAVKASLSKTLPCKTENGIFQGRMSIRTSQHAKTKDNVLFVKIGEWKERQISYDYAFSVLTGELPFVRMPLDNERLPILA